MVTFVAEKVVCSYNKTFVCQSLAPSKTLTTKSAFL